MSAAHAEIIGAHDWAPLNTPAQIEVGTVLRNVLQGNVYVITCCHGGDLYDGTLILAGPHCPVGFGHQARNIDTYDGAWAVLAVAA